MASPSQDAFPNLWRVLGLSVAAGYAGLGSYGAFVPIQCATTYGLRPPNNDPEADKYLSRLMLWVGARDISIAAAISAFYYQENPRAMGTTILAGMLLCTVDTVTIFQAKGPALGIPIGAGAALWGWIGWNLLKL